MIDLHCHVLPGIDDGPETLEDSLALCRAAAAAGTRTVVATPHVSWDWPNVNSRVVADGVARVNEALEAEGLDLEVRPGAEVAMTRAGDLEDSELIALRLGGGPYLLVECPFSPAAAGFDAILHGLVARGHRILLAHPERCPAFQRDRERLRSFVDAGMLTSITAGALVGRFGRGVKVFARELLEQGLVHDIASDGHGAGPRRPPSIGPELEEAGLGDRADWHARAVPLAILDGTPLPASPPPLPRPPWLRRLRRA
ncbi:MAG: protein-tyrosine phosphatase [Solirubrobacteraceae bacterium]|nr:protein-tyrosine phosphatase [Solirubrobacteraceae bacterium]